MYMRKISLLDDVEYLSDKAKGDLKEIENILNKAHSDLAEANHHLDKVEEVLFSTPKYSFTKNNLH